MSQQKWSAVDQYINGMVARSDTALDAALAASAAAGLPDIQVSPNQGKLLHLLARIHGARQILELGTLGGYSTIWLARALPPGGRLITIESDETHAQVARGKISRAGLDGIVELLLGPALEILPRISSEEREPFDLIIIDADKESYPDYLRWALKLSRPGTLIT